MRTVVISDTHGMHNNIHVPDGELLIHCGDSTSDVGRADLRSFLAWLQALPHKHKVFIAGNHDGALEKWPDLAKAMIIEVAPSVHYLQDSMVEIDGVKIWGSPVTPSFCNWFFNRDRGEQIKRHWDMIPEGIDVLVTHGPPAGILDLSGFDSEHCGCKDLLDAIRRVKPRFHFFGHIHHGYGQEVSEGIQFINASVCNERYNPVNKPWVVDITTEAVRG